MLWLILVLLSVITYSISVIFQKILLNNDRNDPIVFSVLFQILTGVIIWIYASLSNQLVWVPISSEWNNLALMTFLYGVGNVFIFKSLQVVDASKFSILFATRGLFTIIGSSILLGEVLKNSQLLGALLILVGIVLVNITRRAIYLGKNDLFAIFAAILFGIANTNDRYLLGSLNLYQFVILSFIVSGLFVGAIYANKLNQVPRFLTNGYWKKMILLSSIYAVSAVLFFGSLQLAPNSSQVASINLTSTILISILGITILRERTNLLNKIIGAAVSVAGLILVTV